MDSGRQVDDPRSNLLSEIPNLSPPDGTTMSSIELIKQKKLLSCAGPDRFLERKHTCICEYDSIESREKD